MQKIDAHQHFWYYEATKDAWITAEMKSLQRNFLPADLYPTLEDCGIDGCISVQADQSEEETRFLLNLAHKNEWIKGVIGWVDLANKDIENMLLTLSHEKKLKDENFLKGISLLEQHHFTYDIVVLHHQLGFINDFVPRFPKQVFILDHLGKPDIKNRSLITWKNNLKQLSDNTNIYCKLSGIVTEANWNSWREEELYDYLDITVEYFGPDRLLFGSDWPVCLLASSYQRWINVMEKYLQRFTQELQHKIWGGNAIRVYNL